jgi:hypothetical protein
LVCWSNATGWWCLCCFGVMGWFTRLRDGCENR